MRHREKARIREGANGQLRKTGKADKINEASAANDTGPTDPLALLADWEREDAIMANLIVDDLGGGYVRSCCERYGLDWRERHVAVAYDVEDGRWEELARALGIASAHPREAVRAWLAVHDSGCAIDSPAWRRLTSETAAQRAAALGFRGVGQPALAAPTVPVTSQQAAVLLVLRERYPVFMTVAGLERRLRSGEKSIRRYLQALRKLGLVETLAPKGGSGLTPAGLALATALPDTPAVHTLLRRR
jgi:hypothetical protein